MSEVFRHSCRLYNWHWNLPVYGYHVHAPIQDKSLPDHALVEFEYWSDASVDRKKQFLALWQTYLRSSADKWRPGIAFSLKENSHYSAVMPLKPGTWNFHLDSLSMFTQPDGF